MFWILGIAFLILCSNGANGNKNVLLIMVDDLRPELGMYTDTDDVLNPNILTPNINTLTRQSIRYTRAYSQYSSCGPSRASILTGRRPDTTQILNNNDDVRDNIPNIVTLPQYFKEQGYLTYGMGKIFHTGHDDNQFSWTEPNFQPSSANKRFWFQEASDGSVWRATERDDKPLPDQEIVSEALDVIDKVANTSQNFFIATGFKKPHLPFICPDNYFEDYPSVDLAEEPYVPSNFPEIAWNYWKDLKDYSDIQSLNNDYNHTVPNALAEDLRQGYYACVSWVDHLVGQLLKRLDDNGLYDDTVVALISDHGFHLGEHSTWAKGTNFLLDTHIPFILRVPGVTDQTRNGIVIQKLVEAVDLFPTLVDAAGLAPLSECPDNSMSVYLCHEGFNAYTYLTADENSNEKSFVLSQISTTFGGNSYMGYSIYNGKYHYVRWVERSNQLTTKEMLEQDAYAEEFYCHDGSSSFYDPNETNNLANDLLFQKAKLRILQKLLDGYKNGIKSG